MPYRSSISALTAWHRHQNQGIARVWHGGTKHCGNCSHQDRRCPHKKIAITSAGRRVHRRKASMRALNRKACMHNVLTQCPPQPSWRFHVHGLMLKIHCMAEPLQLTPTSADLAVCRFESGII